MSIETQNIVRSFLLKEQRGAKLHTAITELLQVASIELDVNEIKILNEASNIAAKVWLSSSAYYCNEHLKSLASE